MLKTYMFSEKEFDQSRRFLNTEWDNFVNIYNDDSIGLIEYSKDSLDDMHIASAREVR